MKNIITLLVLGFTFIMGASAQCSDADKKALEAFDRAWGVATQAGDRAALTAMFADEFMGLPAGINKTTSIDNAVKAAERNKANPNPDTLTHDHYIIACTPNSATITHRNTIWTPNGRGGKPETFYTRSVHFLEKRGGKWMAVSNAGGDIDDSAVIWYLEQDWNNAVMKRDKAWFEKHFAADFRGVSSMTGEVSGKTKDITDMMNDKGLEWAETTDMNVNVDGDRAYVTGIFRTKGKDDKGVAYDRRVRYIDTWVKRDGVWQAWTSQGTPIK